MNVSASSHTSRVETLNRCAVLVTIKILRKSDGSRGISDTHIVKNRLGHLSVIALGCLTTCVSTTPACLALDNAPPSTSLQAQTAPSPPSTSLQAQTAPSPPAMAVQTQTAPSPPAMAIETATTPSPPAMALEAEGTPSPAETAVQAETTATPRAMAPETETTPSPPGAALQTASTQASSQSDEIADVDHKLFHELVALAKFNIHFHLESNRHQKWRALTYPIARETGTAVSLAATLIDLNQQARGLNDPSRISRSALKDAVRCGITANAISGTASALELAQNSYIMLKARQSGYSPDRSLATVQAIIARTDTLLNQRENLSTKEPLAAQRRMLEIETQLVRRIRQQLLYEFATWSAHSRDQAWRENTFYTLDALQNFTRMTAGILAMKTFDQSSFARPAAVTALVANSVATINPIARNIVGVMVRKHQEHKLAKRIQCARPPVGDQLDSLQRHLATQPHEQPLAKLAALTDRTERIDFELDRENAEIRRYRQIAQQQSISGPLIGLTGVTSSTLATIAVYDYSDDFQTATRLGFAGRITQGTGQTYALINTPYTVVKGMLRGRALARRGQLPSQILESRLDRLNLLDATTRGAGASQ